MINEERPQDFELIELLIREAAASTSVQQSSGVDESFRARFQSYIDQIPSYMHSVEKKGFFPHFFFGSFSTLLDTEIAEKLNIERIYFSFEDPKTLKVAVIKKGTIESPQDAADKVKLFVIAESDSINKKFSYGELDNVLGNTRVVQNERVRLARDEGKLGVKLIEIAKEKKKKDKSEEITKISVEVKDGVFDRDTSIAHEFKEIEKGLWSKPEDDIVGLVGPNEKEVEKSCKKVLERISKIHSSYEDSLEYGKESGKTFREAAHHGFVAGALNNFRYRYNLRVYLEQFAGRGYADIVLLARGHDRALDSITIIIELKAGTVRGTAPGDALQQAIGYAKGFQPNVMRVLTTSQYVLCVGLNLDSTEEFAMYLSPPGERKPATPTIDRLLEGTSEWDGKKDTMKKLNDIKGKIKEPLERIYYTFPGTGEKGGKYFSRFLLGQLLFANKFKRNDLKKYVFSYNEYPLNLKKRPEVESSAERPVTTFALIRESRKKEVFIFHIREGGRGDRSDKKVPMPTDLSEQSKITEVYISLHEGRKSDFFDIDEITRYDSLNEYKEGREFFNGELKDIPYPDELKEAFDNALNSQRTPAAGQSLSVDKYNELLKKIGEGVFPFKTFINKEADFQGVLHGAFSYYSDLKLKELSGALVLTEFQTGRGKRIDMLVHGIEGKGGTAKKYTPVGLELKGPRGEISANKLKREANEQITKEYERGVTYKTLTDGDEVKFIGVVFDKKADSADTLISLSRTDQEGFISVKVVHSSTHVLPQVENLHTLESATAKKDYQYWLQQHDIPDIARIEYGYGADTLFEVVGSPEHIATQLQQFKDGVATRGGGQSLTLIVNLGNSHWVTLVIAYQGGQYNGYYADSNGSSITDDIRQILQQGQVTVHDVSVAQQTDGYNCGFWALENARDINTALQGDSHSILDGINDRLQVQRGDEAYFKDKRENVSNRLKIDSQRIANLGTILAETQQSVGQCSKKRGKRNIGMACVDSRDEEDITKEEKERRIKELFDADKVEEVRNIEFYDQLFKIYGQISKGEIVDQNIEKAFITKVKDIDLYSIDPEIRDVVREIKENINDGGIDKGKIRDIVSRPRIANMLVNAAGRISLIRGVHGTFHALQQGDMVEFGLGVGEMAFSPFSQPIEDGVVKFAPKIIKQMKGGVYAARGVGGLIGNAFDIVDLIRSSIDLSKAEGGSKEWRDAIAAVTFPSASIVSGVILTALSMPGVGSMVGFAIVVGQGFYSGASMVAELKKYSLTPGQEFRTFFNTLILQPIPRDVEYTVARKGVVDSLTDQVLARLHDSNDYMVAYAMGLGRIAIYPERIERPGHAVIDMTRYITLGPDYISDYSILFSPFTPGRIDRVYKPDYNNVCLSMCPSTDKKHGYDCTLGELRSFPHFTQSHYCENSMIIGHEKRARNAIRKNISGKIIFDLELVSSGRVQGNSKWKNEFIIYDGTAEVYGGDGTVNMFMLMNSEFKGKIFGGNNATNIINVSNLRRNIRYDSENGTVLDVPTEKINYFIGSAEESERVDCSNSDMVVDSKGAKHDQDHINNCKQVTIYGNTQVKSRRDGDHELYVIPSIGRSSIDIKDKGVIIFPETALLNGCHSITYTVDNALSLEIPLSASKEKFTLDILNYLDEESVSRFTLIDKYGSVIEPLISFSNETLQVDSLALNARTTLSREGIERAVEKTTEEIWKEKQKILEEKEKSFAIMLEEKEIAKASAWSKLQEALQMWPEVYKRRNIILESAKCSSQEKEVLRSAFDTNSIESALRAIEDRKNQAVEKVDEVWKDKVRTIRGKWQYERENVWREVREVWEEVEQKEQALKTALDEAREENERWVRKLDECYDALITSLNVMLEIEGKCLDVVSPVDEYESWKEVLEVHRRARKREGELSYMLGELHYAKSKAELEEVIAKEEAHDDGVERIIEEDLRESNIENGRSELALVAVQKVLDAKVEMEKANQTVEGKFEARLKLQKVLKKARKTIMKEEAISELEELLDKARITSEGINNVKEAVDRVLQLEESKEAKGKLEYILTIEKIEQLYMAYYAMVKDRSALLDWHESIAKSRDSYKVYSV